MTSHAPYDTHDGAMEKLSTLGAAWKIIDPATRRRMALLFLLAMVNAVLEALGLGLVLPVLQILADPESLRDVALVGPFLESNPELTRNTLLTYAIVALIGAYTLKNVCALAVAYATHALTSDGIAEMSNRIFRGYVAAPYARHLETNSATLLRNSILLPQQIYGSVIAPLLSLATEGLFIVAILAVLVAHAPVPALSCVGLLAVSGLIQHLLIRRHAARWGAAKLEAERERLHWSRQSFAAIKDILMAGCDTYFVNMLAEMNARWARYRRLGNLLGDMPRPAMELVAALAAMGAVAAWGVGGLSAASLATIGLFAAAAVRLVPSMSRVGAALGHLKFNAVAIDALAEHDWALEPQTSPGNDGAGTGVTCFGEIRLEDVSFRFPNRSLASLRGVNLTIRKGEAVALRGASGAGKSTLATILCGLLNPSSGRIFVNGNLTRTASPQWRRQVAVIPQDVFLLDDTVRRNVAFGVPANLIDQARVTRAVSQAQLDSVIADLPQGLETVLGENGSRLSGGQKQRVAIARALYRDVPILVMDEATSALDTETENEIVRLTASLKGDRTIIIIAHRQSTIREVDTVHVLDRGCLVETVSRNAALELVEND